MKIILNLYAIFYLKQIIIIKHYKKKKSIIMNLLSGKRLNINDEKKLISVIDKEVVIIREKIMEIIKYETNDTSKNIDPLNEMMFFQLLKT